MVSVKNKYLLILLYTNPYIIREGLVEKNIPVYLTLSCTLYSFHVLTAAFLQFNRNK